VEWRRDASGRPLLMEINPRLAGSLENATKSGVDFPLLLWQWATGQPVEPVLSYRTGVRTRWLAGDIRWLRNNIRLGGRPDTVPVPRAMWTFLWEFARTRHYDYIDRRDMRPALSEMRQTVTITQNILSK
jgi:ATP-grasp in the biosynthetic pathway with Ter operon